MTISMDIVFIGMTLAFFGLSYALLVLCARLMEERR